MLDAAVTDEELNSLNYIPLGWVHFALSCAMLYDDSRSLRTTRVCKLLLRTICLKFSQFSQIIKQNRKWVIYKWQTTMWLNWPCFVWGHNHCRCPIKTSFVSDYLFQLIFPPQAPRSWLNCFLGPKKTQLHRQKTNILVTYKQIPCCRHIPIHSKLDFSIGEMSQTKTLGI